MKPPRFAKRLLALVAPAHLRDSFLDDLDELYAMELRRRDATGATAWYIGHALAAVPSLLRIRRNRRIQRSQHKEPGMIAIDTLTRNLRHAARVLVKAPGFTVAAVATLALGIGANTAIFSLVKTVMLRPLPYENPEQLVMIWDAASPRGVTHLSVQEIVSYGEDSDSFLQVGGYQEGNANLTGGQEPERVRAAFVTGNLFDTLGVGALVGRSFVASDSQPDAAPVAILSHALWQRRFGGSTDVIDQAIQVNGRARTVVGVMPASFRLPLDYRVDRPNEILIPQIIDRANLGQWGNRSFFGVARLKPTTPASAATSELSVISARWLQAGFIRDDGAGLGRSAIPLQEFVTGAVRRPLMILLGAVGVVLLIACANVVNLLLARADARRREVAVRGALGAQRADIVGQLLTESVLLASAGGAIGLLLARGAMEVLKTLRPAGLPRVEDASIDPAALAFTAALSVVTGLVFGLLPAMQLSHQGLATVMNETGRGGAPGKVRVAVRRGLVVVQLAFSVVLVVGAGLLLRSLIELNRIDLGFDTSRVLTAQLQLPVADYPDTPKVVAFYRQLIERLEQTPGVVAAGGARVLPLARTIGDWSITIEHRPTGPKENPNGDYQAVTPGYFKAMGTTLVSGRLLTNADREDAPPVVVINDTMAARYWPGQDPLGKRFQMGGTGSTMPMMTIVGVVRTSRHNAVVEDPRAEMYLPHAQSAGSAGGPIRGVAIVIKTQGDPLSLAEPLRQTVRAIDPNLPVAEMQSMEQITATALAGPRFAAFLLGLFATLALTLAAIGTYATISLLVAERSHEIGIRMALGAERNGILRWVLGEGLTLAGLGIALGTGGALLLTRVLETLLYGVDAFDPLTFVAVPVILAIVAMMASFNPARRAASLDPVSTLRRG
jgi:putative ABC transport system permease protein